LKTDSGGCDFLTKLLQISNPQQSDKGIEIPVKINLSNPWLKHIGCLGRWAKGVSFAPCLDRYKM